MNTTVSYTDIRKNLKSSFDKAAKEHEPILVKRRNGENIVIVSQEDYESLEETAYLLKSPENAKRLIEAIKRKNVISQDRVKDELGL